MFGDKDSDKRFSDQWYEFEFEHFLFSHYVNCGEYFGFGGYREVQMSKFLLGYNWTEKSPTGHKIPPKD